MESLRGFAICVSAEVAEMGPFELVSDGSAIPVFASRMKEGTPYTVYDISHHARARGWQIPAYTMPENATDISVLRVVIREGFSKDLAASLIEGLRDSVAHFENHRIAGPDGNSAYAH
jgi:glutamate decarboxylase